MLQGETAIIRNDGFAACGSLPRQPDISEPSPARSRRLWFEIGVIFFLAPLAMLYAVAVHRAPLFYALPPVLIAIMAFLLLDPSFSLRRELEPRPTRAMLISIFAVFVAGSLLVTAFMALTMPERLFVLPTERPRLWATIMTVYPFTSVLAQEFVYRVFFFHRYGPLFRDRNMIILANGVAFCLGHLLFRNWIAVSGTLIVGMLFAWRYERTRSFWAVWLEHVLWGWLVFTIGLGVFFFSGGRYVSM